MNPAVRRPSRKPERELSPAEIWACEEAAARRRSLEDKLAQHIKAWGLPTPEREYRFDPVRLWRIDFAWPAFKLAVEVEGLTHAGGRHQRIAGYERDEEKHNALQLAGWTLLRFSGRAIRSAFAIRAIQAALEQARNR